MPVKQFDISKIELFRSSIRSEILSITEKWDNSVTLLGSFTEPSDTIYDCYPFLFQGLFPSIDKDNLHSFAVAGRLFAASIFIHDSIIDKDTNDIRVERMFEPLVMQWEAHAGLQKLFSSNSLFWGRFRLFYKEHIEACVLEKSFIKKEWSGFSDEIGREIAVKKNGLARAVIAGLVDLDKNDSLYLPLTDSVNNFNIACQLLDDLIDWKTDLENSRPSMLLADVIRKNGALKVKDAPNPTDLHNSFAKEIYYNGIAANSINKALAYIDKSQRILNDLEAKQTGWFNVNIKTKKKLGELLADIDNIVTANIKRVKTQPKFSLDLGNTKNLHKSLAQYALTFLIDQWKKGFGELRHIMCLSINEGFSKTSGSDYKYGDVFQRALILDSFCCAEKKLDVDLTPVIDYEVEYLIGQRSLDGVGGWRYFPDVLEIAPDVDDLGQIIQALVLAQRKNLIRTYCEQPIKAALEDNLRPDGSIETWIVPKKGRTALQEMQHKYNMEKWGTGPDPEVTANFFYAINLYDRSRFNSKCNKVIPYLENSQNQNGFWKSRWYYGEFYGTYVCMRLIAVKSPQSPSLDLAKSYILETQKADGGWGAFGKSDQLTTALAILGLSCLSSKDTKDVAQAGFQYIKNSLKEDSWHKPDFIKPRVAEPYSSETLTAMYVCKAAVAYMS